MNKEAKAIINEFNKSLEKSHGPITFIPWSQDLDNDFTFCVDHPINGSFAYCFSTPEQLKYLLRLNSHSGDLPFKISVNKFDFGGQPPLPLWEGGQVLKGGVDEFINLHKYAHSFNKEKAVLIAFLVEECGWLLCDAIYAAEFDEDVNVNIFLNQTPYEKMLMEVLAEFDVALLPHIDFAPIVRQRLRDAKNKGKVIIEYYEHTIITNIQIKA